MTITNGAIAVVCYPIVAALYGVAGNPLQLAPFVAGVTATHFVWARGTRSSRRSEDG